MKLAEVHSAGMASQTCNSQFVFHHPLQVCISILEKKPLFSACQAAILITSDHLYVYNYLENDMKSSFVEYQMQTCVLLCHDVDEDVSFYLRLHAEPQN